MKKITILILSLSILNCTNNSENIDDEFDNVFDGFVNLTSMLQVEEFSKQNYTEITGSLQIFETPETNDQNKITSLASLSSLKKIGGGIRIWGLRALTNLEGLNNIESTNIIEIANNKELKDLSAFDGLQVNNIWLSTNPSLRNVENFKFSLENVSSISIGNNPLLENLKCFSNIKHIKRFLSVNRNDNMKTLSGLDNIETVGSIEFINISSLKVSENNMLISLKGLNKLTSVNGELKILNNPSLENIDNISNLSNFTGRDFQIIENLIENLNGLKNLTTLRGDIYILGNPNLTNFCGLKNLFVNNGHSDGSYLVLNNLKNPKKMEIMNDSNCN